MTRLEKTNARIQFVRNRPFPLRTDVIKTGTVTYGPVKVDGINHYRVLWDGDTQEQINAFLPSKKYKYVWTQ